MRFLSNFGSKIIFMCSVNIIIVISKIPTNYLKEALVMWPLSASGLLCYQSVSHSVIQLLNQSFYQPVSQLQVDNQPVPKLLSQSVKMVSWLVRSILSKLISWSVNQSVSWSNSHFMKLYTKQFGLSGLLNSWITTQNIQHLHYWR